VAIHSAFPRTSTARLQTSSRNCGKRLEAEEFSHKAAHFLAELNAIHAFREGNGRSQLSFFALLADNAGHPLNLDRLDPVEMLAAMIASFDGDEQKLATVILELVR
jgi:cell filamentation protein